jgi:hypothetical protein
VSQAQPLQPEGAYLLYLLQVSEDGAMPAWRTDLISDVRWLTTQEVAATYALGRIRESLVHRIKRLEPGSDEQVFLISVVGRCPGEGGDRVTAPRWPAQALGTVRGMIQQRLFLPRAA